MRTDMFCPEVPHDSNAPYYVRKPTSPQIEEAKSNVTLLLL